MKYYIQELDEFSIIGQEIEITISTKKKYSN